MKKIVALFILMLAIWFVSPVFAQTNQQDYNATIKQADNYFQKGDYINAKASYQYASRLRPHEEYPKTKLSETIVKLREKMVVMEQYDAEISQADKLFRLGKYDEAIVKYLDALKVLPDEAYPKNKIAECQKSADFESSKKTEYDQAVTNGEKLIKYRKYEQARQEFENAMIIFPEKVYPRDKLDEIDRLIQERERVLAAYDETIASADRLFNLKYYENARAEYQLASDAKPDEEYPKAKIKEIEGLLGKKNEFDKLVAEADEFYIAKDLESAKSKYQASLTIYPGETYPKDMIDKINTAMGALKGKDELYQKAVADADNFLKKRDYTNAIEEYKNASSIKPAESYPKQKIQEVKALIARSESDELEYNQSVQRGEQYLAQKDYSSAKGEFEKANQLKPNEQYPQDKLAEINAVLAQQKGVQDSFDQSIAKADAFYESKSYDSAIKEYKNALIIIPGSKYATDKLSDINNLKRNLDSKDKQYNGLISDADKLFDKNSLSEARTKYSEALSVDPSQSYPQERIDKIDQVLSNNQDIENQYNKAIATADLFYNKQEYENALVEYQNANNLRPNEKYPIQKISEINKAFADNQSLEDNYNSTIVAADKQFNSGEYAKALKSYKAALALMPQHTYPSEKIAEINKLIGDQETLDEQYSKFLTDADNFYRDKYYKEALTNYQDAQNIRPDNSVTAKKIAEITGILAIIDKDNETYSQTIIQADNLFELKQYEEAKLAYMKAANLRPKNPYPREKVKEVDQLITNQQAASAQYNRIVAAGDRMLEAKEYEKARTKYQEALDLLPQQLYARDQLHEIDKILLASAESNQKNYNALIIAADGLFEKLDYDKAKLKYQNALKLKPEEVYPTQKITEIDQLIGEYEMNKANYLRLIADADIDFKSRDYEPAKTKYLEASALFPKEGYPLEKIEEINLIRKADVQNMQRAYDKAIADADKFFAGNVLDQALSSYRVARAYKPDELYPDQMIEKILAILDKNAVRDLVTSSLNIEGNTLKKFTFAPVSVADRKKNLIYIKARNSSEKDFKVVLSYGKGSSKNGGFIIPITTGEDEKEFIIPIGNQYTWFSQDNDWISLSPQGGSVEVNLIKISKGN
ncbi:MAG: hypothetical protein K8R74_05365 [Bacteroidales bacterium]|nr:hypothetical protein [Bacteroidales bacterium]